MSTKSKLWQILYFANPQKCLATDLASSDTPDKLTLWIWDTIHLSGKLKKSHTHWSDANSPDSVWIELSKWRQTQTRLCNVIQSRRSHFRKPKGNPSLILGTLAFLTRSVTFWKQIPSNFPPIPQNIYYFHILPSKKIFWNNMRDVCARHTQGIYGMRRS